jgi:hypothetical protein
MKMNIEYNISMKNQSKEWVIDKQCQQKIDQKKWWHGVINVAKRGWSISFFHETWLMVANSCLDVNIKQLIFKAQ